MYIYILYEIIKTKYILNNKHLKLYFLPQAHLVCFLRDTRRTNKIIKTTEGGDWLLRLKGHNIMDNKLN